MEAFGQSTYLSACPDIMAAARLADRPVYWRHKNWRDCEGSIALFLDFITHGMSGVDTYDFCTSTTLHLLKPDMSNSTRRCGGLFCFPIREWTARKFTGRIEDGWGQPQYVFYPSIPYSDPNLSWDINGRHHIFPTVFERSEGHT